MGVRYFYFAMFAVGFLLNAWAVWANPAGAQSGPSPMPHHLRTQRGPYRYLRHPMYLGSWFLIVGAAGLAGGVWNVISVGILAELLLREWAWREGQ